jgi:hypothetical protein
VDRLWRVVAGPETAGGAALGAGGVLLHLSGVVAGPLWPLVAIGLAGVGASIGAWSAAQRPRPLLKPTPALVDKGGFDPDAIRAALRDQFRASNGRVPAPVMDRILHIQGTISELLPRVAQFPIGSLEAFVVQQTALDYLPTALQSYLQLPPAYAVSHHVDGQRTPVQVLLDQLVLLDSKLNEVAAAVHKRDSDSLLANGRFLADKFGSTGLTLPAPHED